MRKEQIKEVKRIQPLKKPSRSLRMKTTKSVTTRSGKGLDFEGWSKERLMARARQVGLEGRSKLSKLELIRKLRYH